MSDVQMALLRLKQHSGLPSQGDVPNDTLAENVHRIGRGGSGLDLDAITDEIIDCLNTINRDVNGYAEAVAAQKSVDPQLAYAVSGMIILCLGTALKLRRSGSDFAMADRLLGAAWHIQFAWDALLAGDIADLVEHVLLERSARVGDGQLCEGPPNETDSRSEMS